MDEFISASQGPAFKALFVRNPDLLKAFISDALSLNLTDADSIEPISSEIYPAAERDDRFVVRVITEKGRYKVEFQTSSDFNPDYAFMSWGSLFCAGVRPDDRDEKFEKTYQVSVLDFSYYQTDDYHSSFSFRKNDTFELLDDALSIHVFELPKVPDEPSPEDPAIEWFQVVKADSEEALKKIEARTKNPTILKAIEAARQLNADETLRRAR